MHNATVIESEINAFRLTKFEIIFEENPGNVFDFSSKHNRFRYRCENLPKSDGNVHLNILAIWGLRPYQCTALDNITLEFNKVLYVLYSDCDLHLNRICFPIYNRLAISGKIYGIHFIRQTCIKLYAVEE